MSNIQKYFDLFKKKSVELKLELLEILFEHFDNLTEESILKINKQQVIKQLFSLLKDKNKQVQQKTEEFLEFLLTFFKTKEIKILQKTSNETAHIFIKNFLQNQANADNMETFREEDYFTQTQRDINNNMQQENLSLKQQISQQISINTMTPGRPLSQRVQ